MITPPASVLLIFFKYDAAPFTACDRLWHNGGENGFLQPDALRSSVFCPRVAILKYVTLFHGQESEQPVPWPISRLGG